ncbi:hypothetical protein N5079_29735 [Planotetraspora sp. A-T 1434]|uniref:hypothetical protein n=1 Tax=Planotetraspora sp. A-T 1434 TaxID=2979219 RepID=UPI0021C1D606|nr:hypothetical protein [Planotetraspora sp. A-T 1434]MCT9934394.1 hypothetical protein [Planotetraspora sp. A-T 1434]
MTTQTGLSTGLLTGLPDLGAPLTSLPGAVFRGFDDNGLAVAVPDDLDLERQADGSAALLVTLVRGDEPPYGRIEAGFAVGTRLPEIGAAAVAQGQIIRLAEAEVRGGVLEFTARLGRVAEQVLVPAFELAPGLLARARVAAILSPEAATLAARLVEDATLLVTATLRLTLRAVAPRLPLAVTVDPHDLAVRLAGRVGEGAALSLEELGEALDALLPGQREGRAETLALRLKELLARPELSTAIRYRLRSPDEVARGQEHVDLAVPTAVLVDRVVSLDPFLAARALSGGSLDRHVRRITVPSLPAGHVSVEFAANLPEPVSGLLALFADLRVPPAPPLRPQQVTAGAALDPPGRTGTAHVVLAPGEESHLGELGAEVRLRALLDVPEVPEGASRVPGPAELAGPWQPATDRHLLLGPAAFPLPLTVVRASEALTALAVAEVVTAEGRTPARLDAATPLAAVPRVPGDPPARVVIRPTGPGRTIELPVDGRDRLDLDIVTLPGFGAHQARLACRKPPVQVEWRAEGDAGPPRTIRLQGEGEIRWIATSPFQPGVVWRVATGGVPGAPGQWSAPVAPADGLVIAVDPPEGIVLNGVEAWPDDAEPGVWTYVPPGPFLDRLPGGGRAIGLVEAGAVAFLQVTTRLDVPDQDRDTMRRGLPAGSDLRPAPVTVRRVAVEVRTPDGGWAPVAEGTSSGLPPWTTALSATLDAAQAAAVKAALGGARDRLRLVGELTAPAGVTVRTRDVADLLEIQ